MGVVTTQNDPCPCCGEVERVIKRIETFTFCSWCFDKRFGESAEVPDAVYQGWRLEVRDLQKRRLQGPERSGEGLNQGQIAEERVQPTVDGVGNC